jgi:phosphoglycolate phosphatase
LHGLDNSNTRWLFFDLDGTIADSVPGIEFSIRESFHALGKAPKVQDIRPFIGPGIRTILRNIEPALTESELDLMTLSYRQSYDSIGCLKACLYQGVRETLEFLLRREVQMFIVTNKPSRATMNILQHFGIRSIFREIMSPDCRIPNFSSKGQMLQFLVASYGVDLSSARMIGDTEEDMHAAREANIAFVHSAYGYGSLRETQVDTILQFSNLLEICGY